MPLQRCHECGKLVSSEATACPNCGAPPRPQIQEQARNKKRPSILGAGCMAVFGFLLVFGLIANLLDTSSPSPSRPKPESESSSSDRTETARATPLSTSEDGALSFERLSSDDSVSVEENLFHEGARAAVIQHVKPNELGVGGREFRVKSNPVGEGCFVYDPRTRFHGVERLLVWWVPAQGSLYPLNGPSKMVTPNLPWPREAEIDAPMTSDVVDYVFRDIPMRP